MALSQQSDEAISSNSDLYSQQTDNNTNIFLTEARVYVAGVLMPTYSITIQTSFNAMPQADVSLPSYAELFYIGEMDRVPVHIFVRETMVESPQWILMFEGFITSKTYVNSALQRSLTFHAISTFDILADVQIKFMTQLEDMWQGRLPGASDTEIMIQKANILFPLCLFQYGIGQGMTPGASGDKSKTISVPMEYLENAYGFMYWAMPKDDKGNGGPLGQVHSSNLTKYYAAKAKEMRLMNRFEKLPYFDIPYGKENKFAWQINEIDCGDPKNPDKSTVFPMIYGMNKYQAINLIQSGASTSSPSKSLLEILMFLVEEMEYEFTVFHNPAFHDASDDDKKKAEEMEKELKNTQDEKEKARMQEQIGILKRGRLISTTLKPLMNDSFPPMCNVMYRSLVDSLHMACQFKGTPTRIKVNNIYAPLALITQSSGGPGLEQFGLIDYYPSAKFPDFDKNGNDVIQRSIGSEWFNGEGDSELAKRLDSELYTGPWVANVGTPKWFHYLKDGNYLASSATIKDANGEDVPVGKAFKERFCRRQLLGAKYLPRQLSATTMFDPYITPGFPGVIFDGGDTHFAFAGHVIGVMHTISPAQVTTQVQMNYVRTLNEAAKVEIPNPLSSVQKLTHDPTKLTEIYESLLGTPTPWTKERRERPELLDSAVKIPGAQAKSFADLNAEFESNSADATDPNNNPQEAYKLKRRNVVTFDQYCSFMGYSAVSGPGPEGPATPIMLSGNGIDKRRPIDIYVYANQLKKEEPKKEEKKEDDKNPGGFQTSDPMLPKEEQNVKPKQEEEQKKEEKTADGEKKEGNEATDNALKDLQYEQKRRADLEEHKELRDKASAGVDAIRADMDAGKISTNQAAKDAVAADIVLRASEANDMHTGNYSWASPQAQSRNSVSEISGLYQKAGYSKAAADTAAKNAVATGKADISGIQLSSAGKQAVENSRALGEKSSQIRKDRTAHEADVKSRTSTTDKIQNNANNTNAKKEDEQKKPTQKEKQAFQEGTDIRTLLRSIAEREFATLIYK